MYNNYAINEKGLRLKFNILPSSVNSIDAKMVFVNESDDYDIYDSLDFYRSNGEIVTEDEQISSNETIYCKAKDSSINGTFRLIVQSVYNSDINELIEFNVKSGITSLAFNDSDDLNLELNGNNNFKTIFINASPLSADISQVSAQSKNEKISIM
jgi:hypothetical protein